MDVETSTMIANWFTGVVAAVALIFAAWAAKAASQTNDAQQRTLDL